MVDDVMGMVFEELVDVRITDPSMIYQKVIRKRVFFFLICVNSYLRKLYGCHSTKYLKSM